MQQGNHLAPATGVKGAVMAAGKGSWRCLIRAVWCAGLLSGIILTAGCDRPIAADKPAQQGAEQQTARMAFADLFDVNGAMVTPKKIIRFGSTTMTPEVPFEAGVMRIDNEPFANFIGRDADVKKEGELYRILQFH
jgi:hypothetical protein